MIMKGTFQDYNNVSMWIRACVCVCVYAHMCVHVCVCAHVQTLNCMCHVKYNYNTEVQ